MPTDLVAAERLLRASVIMTELPPPVTEGLPEDG